MSDSPSAGAQQPSPFGRRIREIRVARGYSAGSVAAAGGFSDSHLVMIENGVRGKRVSRDMVLKIAQGLKATKAEREELLDLAGYGPPGEPPAPSVIDAINADPRLRSDEKKALLDLYATMVRVRR